jgi:hypothetical protein
MENETRRLAFAVSNLPYRNALRMAAGIAKNDAFFAK